MRYLLLLLNERSLRHGELLGHLLQGYLGRVRARLLELLQQPLLLGLHDCQLRIGLGELLVDGLDLGLQPLGDFALGLDLRLHLDPNLLDLLFQDSLPLPLLLLLLLADHALLPLLVPRPQYPEQHDAVANGPATRYGKMPQRLAGIVRVHPQATAALLRRHVLRRGRRRVAHQPQRGHAHPAQGLLAREHQQGGGRGSALRAVDELVHQLLLLDLEGSHLRLLEGYLDFLDVGAELDG
mmetsp:Transcript_13217/g.39405  ORF Transcript_13217/g.39405 Transcript_13217/m.39405 type:complete len:239 (+) Transcript_13217:1050-1766(+)